MLARRTRVLLISCGVVALGCTALGYGLASVTLHQRYAIYSYSETYFHAVHQPVFEGRSPVAVPFTPATAMSS